MCKDEHFDKQNKYVSFSYPSTSIFLKLVYLSVYHEEIFLTYCFICKHMFEFTTLLNCLVLFFHLHHNPPYFLYFPFPVALNFICPFLYRNSMQAWPWLVIMTSHNEFNISYICTDLFKKKGTLYFSNKSETIDHIDLVLSGIHIHGPTYPANLVTIYKEITL